MGEHWDLKKLSTKEKADAILKRSKDREYFYGLCLKLFSLCDSRGLRLVVENPYAPQHYLVGNFPYRAAIIDRNRAARGDFFKKPTQYWFINCTATYGFSEQQDKEIKSVWKCKSGKEAGLCSEERSMISPDYARNFICDFILGKEQEEYPQLFNPSTL